MGIEITADVQAIEKLGVNIVAAKKSLLWELSKRGYDLLWDEVPYERGNLRQGIAFPSINGGTSTSPNHLGKTALDYQDWQTDITISARSGATLGGSAEVFNAKGERVKSVSLRPSEAYNYADVVARGNKDAVLSPTHARAFLIPVSAAPSGEGYLLIGGQAYVLRKTRKGQKGNPFDQRAADRLDKEKGAIGEAVLKEFV